MNDSCKSEIDNGVSIIGSQFGYSGNGPIATCENLQSSDEGFTAENLDLDQGTGIGINIPEGETVQPPPDGKKGWLIVFAAVLLFSFSTIQTTLQPSTLQFFGTKSPGTKTNDPGLSQKAAMELKLDQLLDILLQNDRSVVENITLILHALNRTHEIESLILGKRDDLIAHLAVVQSASTTVIDTQKLVFSFFGVVTSTLILIIGYRWVGLLGSVVLGLGCLGSAFCDNSNIHLVSFLYGALPGIGQNMVTVCCTVAVIEYFKKRRLVALLLPTLASVVVSFAMSVLVAFIFNGQGFTNWKSYLLMQAGVAGAMIPISLILKPLNLKMKDETSSSLVSRIFGIDGLKIYSNPILYTFAFVWFLWYGGYAVIMNKLPKFKGLNLIPFIAFGQMLSMILGLAIVIGACISCCLPKLTLRATIIIISFNFFAAGFFNLLTSQLYNFIYAIIFSGALGIFQGVISPYLQFAIPLIVGEDNVVIGTGIVLMGQGLGSLSMKAAADEIEKMTKTVDGCFYLAGALFLLGLGFTALTYHLSYRSNKIEITKRPENQAQTSRTVNSDL